MRISCGSFEDTRYKLRLSDVLYALRNTVDLSSYIPPSDGSRRSLVFEELMEAYPEMNQDELRAEMRQCEGRCGVYFTPEYPRSSAFIAIPSDFLSLREKVYHLNVVYKEDEGSEMVSDSKIAARCGVKRTRMSRYTLEDFLRMSQQRKLNYVSNLVCFRSKQYDMHRITLKRCEPTIFSRKKFILSNGSSYPHGFYLNATLDAADKWTTDQENVDE